MPTALCVRYGRVVRLFFFSLFVLALPLSARAQETRTGYQLGVSQSAGTTVSDDRAGLESASAASNEQNVSSLRGVQFTTSVDGNLTFDVVTRALSHAFMTGVGFTQLIPTAVPDEAGAALHQRTSSFQATAGYVARIVRPTWGFDLGLRYNFGLNGRLGSAANGSVSGGGAGQTLPGEPAGAFVVNGRTHAVQTNLDFELTEARWDLGLGLDYGYSHNGIFTLAAGSVASQSDPSATGTNLGSFVPASVHTMGGRTTLRESVGAHGTITAALASHYSLPASASTTGTTAAGASTTIAIPEVVNNQCTLAYTHLLSAERHLGVEATTSYGLRVPSDARGQTEPDARMSSDAAIWTARMFYRDFIRLGRLSLDSSAGVAQAFMFQAPLGQTLFDPDAPFDTIHSGVEPIFNIALRRTFDPVDVALSVGRTVGPGTLGASAVLGDGASVTASYAPTFWTRRVVVNLGLNANRTRGIGRELFRARTTGDDEPEQTLVEATNNDGFGALLSVGVPLFESEGFAIDLSASYAFNWIDRDPDDRTPDRSDGRNLIDSNGSTLIDACTTEPLGAYCITLPPTTTHVALALLRATFGRGTLEHGTSGRPSDALDAYSTNPLDGAELPSSRLVGGGADGLSGTHGPRPGVPPRERGDSRARYDREREREESLEQARPIEEADRTPEIPRQDEPSEGVETTEPTEDHTSRGGFDDWARELGKSDSGEEPPPDLPPIPKPPPKKE